MNLRAYAKINLSLDITGKRQDGYHNIDTIMQAISLHDTIDLTKNREGKIKVTSSKIILPLDEGNTVYAAAKVILEYCNIKDMGVNIHLVKNIPIQAGLGGGSADAAAVLLGIDKMFELGLTDNELLKLAAKVGADVPFCLNLGAARCLGIGDIIEEITPLPPCHVLVCKPPIGVSSAKAYEKSDKYPQDEFFFTPSVLEALKNGNLEEIAASLGNRFDDVLCISDVQVIKSIMLNEGALGASMSGSGSAVFGVFNDENLMKKAATVLNELGEIYCCKPINSEEDE